MPHEKVKFHKDVFQDDNNLLVTWNRNRLGMGWVQVAVVPPVWENTGDWSIVDMSVDDIDRTIKLLKKARKQLTEAVDWEAIVEPKIGKYARFIDKGLPHSGLMGKIVWANKDHVKVIYGIDNSSVVGWDDIEIVENLPRGTYKYSPKYSMTLADRNDLDGKEGSVDPYDKG